MSNVAIYLTEMEVCFILEALIGEGARWENSDPETMGRLNLLRSKIGIQLCDGLKYQDGKAQSYQNDIKAGPEVLHNP